MSRLLRTFYQLRYHQFAVWALDRWLATLAFGTGLIVWLIGRGDPSWPAWLYSALLALVGIVIVVLRLWAAGRMYVVFRPQPGVPAPAAAILDPTDKIQVHVTGQFAVEEKRHFFADLLAYWRTFATREHAVMAIQHPSRYLAIGTLPAEDTGMWYIFFRPAMLTAVTAGELAWGGLCRPALEVRYQFVSTEQPSGWRRLLRRPAADGERQVVYLAFDEQPARLQVWADLLAD